MSKSGAFVGSSRRKQNVDSNHKESSSMVSRRFFFPTGRNLLMCSPWVRTGKALLVWLTPGFRYLNFIYGFFNGLLMTRMLSSISSPKRTLSCDQPIRTVSHQFHQEQDIGMSFGLSVTIRLNGRFFVPCSPQYFYHFNLRLHDKIEIFENLPTFFTVFVDILGDSPAFSCTAGLRVRTFLVIIIIRLCEASLPPSHH